MAQGSGVESFFAVLDQIDANDSYGLREKLHKRYENPPAQIVAHCLGLESLSAAEVRGAFCSVLAGAPPDTAEQPQQPQPGMQTIPNSVWLCCTGETAAFRTHQLPHGALPAATAWGCSSPRRSQLACQQGAAHGTLSHVPGAMQVLGAHGALHSSWRAQVGCKMPATTAATPATYLQRHTTWQGTMELRLLGCCRQLVALLTHPESILGSQALQVLVYATHPDMHDWNPSGDKAAAAASAEHLQHSSQHDSMSSAVAHPAAGPDADLWRELLQLQSGPLFTSLLKLSPDVWPGSGFMALQFMAFYLAWLRRWWCKVRNTLHCLSCLQAVVVTVPVPHASTAGRCSHPVGLTESTASLTQCPCFAAVRRMVCCSSAQTCWRAWLPGPSAQVPCLRSVRWQQPCWLILAVLDPHHLCGSLLLPAVWQKKTRLVAVLLRKESCVLWLTGPWCAHVVAACTDRRQHYTVCLHLRNTTCLEPPVATHQAPNLSCSRPCQRDMHAAGFVQWQHVCLCVRAGQLQAWE